MTILIIKGLIGGLIQLALFSVAFIIPAGLVPEGTWYWDRALIFLVVYGVILTITILTLAVKAPANLEARLKAPTSRNQPMADRIITTIMTLFMLGWFVFIPIDVFFFKIMPAPHIIVSVCGGVLFLLGYAIIVTAIYQNAFATPIVEDQTESGQTLKISTRLSRIHNESTLSPYSFYVVESSILLIEIKTSNKEIQKDGVLP